MRHDGREEESTSQVAREAVPEERSVWRIRRIPAMRLATAARGKAIAVATGSARGGYNQGIDRSVAQQNVVPTTMPESQQMPTSVAYCRQLTSTPIMSICPHLPRSAQQISYEGRRPLTSAACLVVRPPLEC